MENYIEFDETRNNIRIAVVGNYDEVGIISYESFIIDNGETIFRQEFGAGENQPPHNNTLESVLAFTKRKVRWQ